MSSVVSTDEKFSGHESFVCRYGWLRKAYDGVSNNARIFTDVDMAIVSLGVGSNMVKSMEFWGKAFEVIAPVDKKSRQYSVTPFGRAMLDLKSGKDPYLEDLGSLWLLHWKLVTRANLAAWNLVFQELQEWRITQSRLIEMLHRRGRRNGAPLVESTVKQHLEMLLHTYTTTASANLRALEESLGSPLQELGLLSRRETDGISKDTVIEIKIGPKLSLPAEVFLVCVVDHWNRMGGGASISLQEIMFGHLSPGVVFKLDEASVIEYLSRIPDITDQLTYQDGALIRGLQLRRTVKLEDVRKRLRFA